MIFHYEKLSCYKAGKLRILGNIWISQHSKKRKIMCNMFNKSYENNFMKEHRLNLLMLL